MQQKSTNIPKLVLLESDASTANRFIRSASHAYHVVVSRSVEQALALVKSDASVATFVAGSFGNSATAVLEQVKLLRTDVLRVIMAGPDDLLDVIAALHSGAVQRTIHVPATDRELLAAIALPTASAARPALGRAG